MIINAIVAIVGITAGSLFSHYEARADLQTKAAEEFAKQSQTYVAQTASSPRGNATLGICQCP